jgi:ribosomal protein S18 acetylase RimI-like enzyme
MTIEQLTTFSSEVADALRQLAQKIGKNYKPLTDNDIREMLDSPGTHLFVAKEPESGAVVGMVTLIVYRTPYIKKAVMEDVIVDDAYRGKGIASLLVRRALSQAFDNGVSYVDCTSHPGRIAGNNLYEKLGFVKRDTNVYRMAL